MITCLRSREFQFGENPACVLSMYLFVLLQNQADQSGPLYFLNSNKFWIRDDLFSSHDFH